MVNLMVYCKLKEKKDTFAVYNIGTTVEDMTGEIAFYKDAREPEVLKQAEEYPVRTMHIARIYSKYMQDFANGIFKEKLAYEIG